MAGVGGLGVGAVDVDDDRLGRARMARVGDQLHLGLAELIELVAVEVIVVEHGVFLGAGGGLGEQEAVDAADVALVAEGFGAEGFLVVLLVLGVGLGLLIRLL